MERTRQAEMKRQFEILVNNMKVKKIPKNFYIRINSILAIEKMYNVTNSNDMAVLSIEASCSQIRPKSVNHQSELVTYRV
jgi:ribosome maturation protein Sdo1